MSSLNRLTPYVCTPCLFSSLRTRFAQSLTPVAIHQYATATKTRDQSKAKAKKKRKGRTHFRNQELKDSLQFSLCDAMRYIKAFEVGRDPNSAKYDLAIRLKTLRSAPTIRSRVQLPFTVSTSARICVICPPGSSTAKAALAAGATLVGEDDVLNTIKEGRINFDKCLCHIDSADKLNKANLGRILGPKGLMPNVKNGTITKNVTELVKDMAGGTEYRERLAVIRCAVGQLCFNPEQLQRNIRAMVAAVQKDIVKISDKVSKDIHEVVLSSTNSPGFSLNGEFRGPDSVSIEHLSVV